MDHLNGSFSSFLYVLPVMIFRHRQLSALDGNVQLTNMAPIYTKYSEP